MLFVKKGIFHILLLIVSLPPALAQKPVFYLGFDQILDNREYNNTAYGYPQTIFGARINPGAFVTFNKVHQIHAGINYMYEFGGKLLGVTPQIDLYYSYQSAGTELYMGSFPRNHLVDYPLIMITDSLNYYRPNIEGAYFRFHNDWASVHGWMDWMGRVSDEVRESIQAGVEVTLKAGAFYLRGISTRGHLARTIAVDDKNHVRNEGSVIVFAGVDLSKIYNFKHLDISSGWFTNFQHEYPIGYEWNQGWLSQVDIQKGMFGMKGSWYMGEPTYLQYGDRLYSHGDYGRIDFYIDPFRNPRITSKIGWNLHWLPGDGLYHSQQLLIQINL
jgi:hypothetical protein